MRPQRRSSTQGRHTFLSVLPVGSAMVSIVAVFCIVAALVQVSEGLPSRPSSAAAASHDSRVAALRNALRTEHRLETIPDPPLELGIHTACRKFGRGCPDTYVAFLEDVVASLRPIQETDENETSNSTGAADTATSMTQEPAGEKAKGQEERATPSATPAVTAHTSPPAGPAESSHASPSISSHVLRLPVQTTWSYPEYLRLTNLLVRVRVAETQLHTSGIATRAVQRQYGIPPADALVLHDDLSGVVATQVGSVCASLRSEGSASPALANWTADEIALHATWCRHMEHRQRINASAAAPYASTNTAFQLAQLPATPLRCRMLDVRRWQAQLLLLLDPFLLFVVSWTWTVALPSAVITAVALWVCVGDGWGREAEEVIFVASERSETTAEEGTTSPGEEGEEADGVHDTADSPELLSRERYRLSRLAGLRFTFMECAVHRSWFTSFLKLRLVLCLLVAGDFCWNFAQVLYTTWRPAAAVTDASADRLVLSTSINLLLYLLPTWLRVVVNVYLILVVQGAVLIVALKGAASAYADWQDFTAACAAEQEYLLTAVVDAAHPPSS